MKQLLKRNKLLEIKIYFNNYFNNTNNLIKRICYNNNNRNNCFNVNNYKNNKYFSNKSTDKINLKTESNINIFDYNIFNKSQTEDVFNISNINKIKLIINMLKSNSNNIEFLIQNDMYLRLYNINIKEIHNNEINQLSLNLKINIKKILKNYKIYKKQIEYSLFNRIANELNQYLDMFTQKNLDLINFYLKEDKNIFYFAKRQSNNILKNKSNIVYLQKEFNNRNLNNLYPFDLYISMLKIKPFLDVFHKIVYSDLLYSQFNKKHNEYLEKISFANDFIDLQEPHLWFPSARSIKRNIIYHYGPTNSGKTSSALKSLKDASNGLYCAPLRLLAWEIHEKLKHDNIIVNLLTGQESIINNNNTHVSCTIEKCPLDKQFDVAIIDEIQMISDPIRGNAWTRAFLGIKANTVHLCGDEKAINLIKELSKKTNDNLELKMYNRFSKLEVIQNKVDVYDLSYFKNNLNNKVDYNKNYLLPGDCIITFTRLQVLKYKQNLNKIINIMNIKSNLKVNCIYGALPPNTKKNQAELFNDELNIDNQYSILVATDAIGLGLNLNIKRIIFSDIFKYDGTSYRLLNLPEINQIAGRAGRSISKGYVSSTDENNLTYIKEIIDKRKIEEQNMSENGDSKNESKACVYLELDTIKSIIRSYELIYSETKLHLYDLLMIFEEVEKLDKTLYVLKDINKIKKIAKITKLIENAKIEHEYIICNSPVKRLNNDTKKLILTVLYQISNDLEVPIPLFVKDNIYKYICILDNYFPETGSNCYDMYNYDSNILNSNTQLYFNNNNSNIFEDMFNLMEVYIYIGNNYLNKFVDINLAFEFKTKLSIMVDLCLIKNNKLN